MSGVGEQLRAAREAKGLTIEQVAEATKLKLVQVEALEKGDFSEFPAPVYARGSLKNYADAVKIDPAPLLKQMQKEMQGERANDAPVLETSTYHGPDLDSVTYRLSLAWRVILPILVIGVFLLAGYWSWSLWRSYGKKDPLNGLGPGYYDGTTQSENVIETLPLPPVDR